MCLQGTTPPQRAAQIHVGSLAEREAFERLTFRFPGFSGPVAVHTGGALGYGGR